VGTATETHCKVLPRGKLARGAISTEQRGGKSLAVDQVHHVGVPTGKADCRRLPYLVAANDDFFWIIGGVLVCLVTWSWWPLIAVVVSCLACELVINSL
jgi:hypothetical protein